MNKIRVSDLHEAKELDLASLAKIRGGWWGTCLLPPQESSSGVNSGLRLENWPPASLKDQKSSSTGDGLG